ncbi:heterokaryon incompatibility protein-domain-containing protein [Lophiotrema nucula]|uniref:Heterokaryon incompatibility protein-domain-containing protein n=1 Tax=Lophiotrema nucula TaxID=690887 RepID=A0A6A5ZJL2_9PLEO|nr:heterokaryon incompatibility protein-domain-containing protein [Lophiotrema nucula]
MRLLETETMHMLQIPDDEVPRYAILSHTWGHDEIFFQDFSRADPKSSVTSCSKNLRGKLGWAKIEGACQKALDFDCRYIWVDTCCIDKSSSSELQEAINSMFRWYKDAYICLAYLADVSSHQHLDAKRSAFRKARWFTRGWTLQELLAPEEVIFFDQSWEILGSKHDLCEVIEAITGIEAVYLGSIHSFPRRLSKASVAEKMSWAAERETTRKEDIAYCLLGIFGIYMPMLYGEGSRAFIRLQEEIMKVTDDNSMLCWGYKEDFNNWRRETATLLAPHPGTFRNCRNIGPLTLDGFTYPSFLMNQKGLSVTFPVRPDQTHEHIVYGILGCGPKIVGNVERGANTEPFLAIPLVSTRACDGKNRHRGPQNDEYLRPNWCRAVLVSKAFLMQAKTQELVIRRNSEDDSSFRRLPIAFGLSPIPTQVYDVLGIYPPQPLGAQFNSLCAYPSPRKAKLQRKFQRPEGLLQRLGLKKDDDWIEHAESGQRMVHIDFPSGALLIVLDYTAVTVKSRLLPLWDHMVSCRVFELPGAFSLELLHNLAITQNFVQLQELQRSHAGNNMFNIMDNFDFSLEVEIRKPDHRFGISDVIVFVTDKSNKGETLLEWIIKGDKRPRERSRSHARLSTSGRKPEHLFSPADHSM